MNIRSLRFEYNVQAKDVVQVVRNRFPKYDKALQSKVERPDDYGIRLVPEAEKVLLEFLENASPERLRRTGDCHRLKTSVRCRLPKEVYVRLQQALKGKGFNTMQAGLTYIIDKYLEEEL